MNFLRKKILIFGGGFLAVLLAAGFFVWHQSQGKIEYQSTNSFQALAPIEGKEEESVSSDTEQKSEVEEKKEEIASGEAMNNKGEAPGGESEQKNGSKETENYPLKSFSVKKRLVSFGHERKSGRKIEAIILHSSYAVSGDPYNPEAVIALWQSYGVAPHYMVARDGTVYQLVADGDVAYHAGESQMPDGRTGVNDFSIGIEILNTKDDQYTKAQYQAVRDLVSSLKGKYKIKDKNIVGHSTIAPGRKTDPWNFDWSKL
jgi:hypothetical protein